MSPFCGENFACNYEVISQLGNLNRLQEDFCICNIDIFMAIKKENNLKHK